MSTPMCVSSSFFFFLVLSTTTSKVCSIMNPPSVCVCVPCGSTKFFIFLRFTNCEKRRRKTHAPNKKIRRNGHWSCSERVCCYFLELVNFSSSFLPTIIAGHTHTHISTRPFFFFFLLERCASHLPLTPPSVMDLPPPPLRN